MRLLAVLLLLGGVALAGKGIFVTPDYWIRVTMSKCKLTGPTTERCTADIEFAGYTLKQPLTNTYRVPKYKLEVKK